METSDGVKSLASPHKYHPVYRARSFALKYESECCNNAEPPWWRKSAKTANGLDLSLSLRLKLAKMSDDRVFTYSDFHAVDSTEASSRNIKNQDNYRRDQLHCGPPKQIIGRVVAHMARPHNPPYRPQDPYARSFNVCYGDRTAQVRFWV